MEYKQVPIWSRSEYFSKLISKNQHNTKFLLDTIAKLTKKSTHGVSTDLSPNDFLNSLTKTSMQ